MLPRRPGNQASTQPVTARDSSRRQATRSFNAPTIHTIPSVSRPQYVSSCRLIRYRSSSDTSP